MKLTYVVVVVGAALAVACGGKETQQAQPAPAAPPATAAPATTMAPAAEAGGEAEFGVPECDSYLQKYMACVDSKVPEAARGMMRDQLEKSKEQWKQAASTPEGKQGLAMACSQAEAAAKTAMSAYGCTW